MKKGTKVSWLLRGPGTIQQVTGGGSGTVITDEVDGKVQVAVESQWGQGQQWENEMHYVIWCNVTWLSIVA